MSRNRDKEPLLDFDPEPERTFRQRLQQGRLYKAAESTMDHNNVVNANVANPIVNEQPRRVLDSYTAPNADLYGKSIVVPLIAANNFELKPQLVTLICDTVKTNGVNPDVYKLMLFLFALRDKAKLWLDSQSKESLDTWKKVVTGFLTKFFPPKKLTKLRVEVQTFKQKDGETLYEAWERYKLLTRQCPPDMNPVNSETPQKKGVIEVEALDAILAQNKILSQQMSLISQQLSRMQVNYMGNAPRNPNNDPYSKTYNQGWREQPRESQNFNSNSQGSFQQNNHNNRQFQSHHQQPPQQKNSQSQKNTDMEAVMNRFMQETRASLRNLEVQVGQLSKQIPERPPSTFPGDTMVNPREKCKAISLISGQVASTEAQVNEEPVEEEASEEKKEEVENVPPKRADNPFPDSLDTYPTLPKVPEYKPKMPYP
ncbi:hypothetical protein AHAS_Ahas13G0188100 [Arachis hypogaea]